MNIQFQMSGFLICLLLFIVYTSKKRLNLYSENVFYYMMIMSMFLLLTDMLSVWAIVQSEELPKLLVVSLCKLYLAFLLFEIGMALAYILLDVAGEKRHKTIVNIVLAAAAVESLVVACLPIQIYHEGDITYTYGTSTVMTYVFGGSYFLTILGIVVFFRKKIFSRRWIAFVIWLVCWVSAAAIQFMAKELLIAGYAVALGMMLLYVMLENPEVNLSQEYGCFNLFALRKFLRRQYNVDKPFFLYSFSLDDSVGNDNPEILRAVKKALKFPKTYVFKELNMDFLLLTEDEEDRYQIRKWVETAAESGDNLFEHIQVMYCEHPIRLNSSPALAKFLTYFRNKFAGEGMGVVTYLTDDMIDEFLNQGTMIAEIEKALEEDRVEVFLQPIYSNAHKHFSSAEALVRIRRNDGSYIPPGMFIPVAESSGMIVELGERIFEKTCQFLQQYKPWELGIEYIEVNLSVLQCEEEGLAQTLMEIMDTYGVEPERINLEITETATLNAKKKLLKNMDTLIGQGCTFSLDDFGKGESNLMYIVEMPVHIVKLDYDMTKAYHQSTKAQSVVRSVVTMAHDMGLKVVAEGIETKEELACMIEQEIDYIQGYYFSKPLPMIVFHEFIKTNQTAG